MTLGKEKKQEEKKMLLKAEENRAFLSSFLSSLSIHPRAFYSYSTSLFQLLMFHSTDLTHPKLTAKQLFLNSISQCC